MKPPTSDEFRLARALADQDDTVGTSADAYQLCRWYRGQMFYRAQAEAALTKIRATLKANESDR